MFFLAIFQDYFLWHYTRAFQDILHVWKNFLWFWVHFFSLPELLRHWFAPFKRITEARGETWRFEDLAGYLVIGLFSRLIGGLIRTILILVGCVALISTVIGGFIIYLFWVCAPIIVVALLVSGVGLIFI